jgi:hypothetical protein
MNKLIAIATAGCMLVAASAPAIAAPEVSAAPAAAQTSPTIGTRAKLVKRASATARGKSNKFLGLASLDALLIGVGSVFAVAAGVAASSGSGNPGSS